jgi:membrane-bound hydrogenase subunit beta
MEKEQTIQTALIAQFDFLKENCHIIRDRRMTLQVPSDQILPVLEHLKKNVGFDHLCTITGLDLVEQFQVIYHISNADGILLNIKLNVAKDKPVIKTCLGIFAGALFYERDLKDLLGIEVDGIPAGRRYPLPDDWPLDQHPLRKDWKQSTVAPEGGMENG